MNAIDFFVMSEFELSWARTEKGRGGYIIHNKKTGIHSVAKYTPPRIRGLGTWQWLYNSRTNTFFFYFSGYFLYSVVVILAINQLNAQNIVL